MLFASVQNCNENVPLLLAQKWFSRTPVKATEVVSLKGNAVYSDNVGPVVSPCTVGKKLDLGLEQAMKAQTGSRVIALLFL